MVNQINYTFQRSTGKTYPLFKDLLKIWGIHQKIIPAKTLFVYHNLLFIDNRNK
jgi:hypothetical protein